jgi:uncharacterized repeat protein (TIGR01451 family)
MKRFAVIGLGVIALSATVPLVGTIPGLPNISAIAQNIQHQPQLHLELDVAKQVQDKRHITWQSLQGQASVKPKDVLRYTISGENYSDRAVKNLTLNQPIPKGMQLVLKSATATNNAKITYSIDGGRSFSENPTIKVTLPKGKVEIKPAPATAYTHIHLNFNQPIPAKTKVQGTYQVQVL